MRRHALVVLSLTLSTLAACMVRASPTDKSVERTLPFASAPTTLPRQLRVVTFNVHRESPDVLIRGIRSDRTLLDADLIILQEVHRVEPSADPCSAACALGKELHMYTHYAPGHVQGDGTDGVAILSHAPILDSEVLELPDIDVHVNSGRRVALASTILVDGTPVTVYAVHLTNRLTVKERLRQMRPILEHAKQKSTPIIMAGDFNTSPYTWLGGLIPIPIGTQDDHLEDMVRSYGLETPVATVDATSRFMNMKLDAIYTRGFATYAFATSNADSISDHLALWANVELRPSTASAKVAPCRSTSSATSCVPGASSARVASSRF
ncbi:MAG: endonuclease/exonuclease/phosphatase family protein [Kofleriaceae bacterium]